MSKKKKALVAVAILSSLLLAFIGGQSYSKYISEIRGEGTMEVATWSFKVNGSAEERQNISLPLTSYDPSTLANGKIAPGTKGSFNIVVDGTGSEVGISYAVAIENVSYTPTNLFFTYEGIDYQINELGTFLTGIINANDSNKTDTIKIDWHWDYETETGIGIGANDLIDTADAKMIQQFTFDVVVRAEQVKPVEN